MGISDIAVEDALHFLRSKSQLSDKVITRYEQYLIRCLLERVTISPHNWESHPLSTYFDFEGAEKIDICLDYVMLSKITLRKDMGLFKKDDHFDYLRIYSMWYAELVRGELIFPLKSEVSLDIAGVRSDKEVYELSLMEQEQVEKVLQHLENMP